MLTPMASRENINGVIAPMDVKEKAVTGARLRSGAESWRDVAVIFARSASRRRADLPLCH